MAGQKILSYSFLDVHAFLQGPGVNVPLGTGAGIAEEGITVEFLEEADNMLIGADGSVAHSLHASKAGKVTVRLLKTSPTNALLTQAYNFQRQSTLNWGQNTIVVTNPVTGDVYTCTQAAFAKYPSNTWAKDASTIDWEFLAGRVEPVLGGAGLLIA